MKKVVFEGIINGEKFDNVADYNKKMNELLSSGELNIKASSNTRVIDEPEVKKELKKETDINDFLPFVIDGNFKLDRLNGTNEDYNIIDSCGRALYRLRDLFMRTLDDEDFTLEQLIDLSKAVKNVKEEINDWTEAVDEDLKDLNDAIEETKKELENLEKEYKASEHKKPILELLTEYYDDVWKSVRNYLIG